MSLDLSITATRPTTVYSENITHNLAPMAKACGLYDPLWNSNGSLAGDLIEPVRAGVIELVTHASKYRPFNPANGWGDYERLVYVSHYFLNACVDNPDGIVGASK